MKILGTVLIAMLLAALSAPAYAQTGPSARISSPSDGAVLSDVVTVRGGGHATTGVRRIKIIIGSRTVAIHEYSELRQDMDVSYSWNTAQSPTGGPAPNGSYQVKVEVTASSGATNSKAINVSVDNAPQIPTGLEAAVMQQSVELSWAANPEPDIIGYRVEGYSDGSWSMLAQTSETRHVMNVSPGTHQYRVSAIRNSPTMAEGRPSAPSEPLTVTVSAPATRGGAGSGKAGGKRGGTSDPRIFGRDGKVRARDVAATARRGFAGGGISSWNLSLPGQVALPEVPGAQPVEWGSYKERLPYSIPKGGMPLASMPTSRLAAISTSTFIPADGLRWVAAGLLMMVIAGLMQMVSMMAARAEELGPAGAAIPAGRSKNTVLVSIRRSIEQARRSAALVSIRRSIEQARRSAALVSIRRSIEQASRSAALVSIRRSIEQARRSAAVGLSDAIVRIRRVPDRVRTAWQKARSS